MYQKLQNVAQNVPKATKCSPKCTKEFNNFAGMTRNQPCNLTILQEQATILHANCSKGYKM
jgi:hypothetical protein